MKSKLITILLDPLAVAGGGAGTTQTQPTQGQQGSQPEPASQAIQQGSGDRGISFNPSDDPSGGAASGVSGDQGGSSGVAALGQQQGGAGGEWESVVDVARGLGYDFGGREYADDRQFLLDLLNTATNRRQEDYYAQLGRQIAPHYQGVQQYLQQQGQQPQQQAQRPSWEPPPFNEQWLQLVERDPNSGVFLARPGVDPQIATAVNEYDRWYQQVGRNPVAAIQPYVEQSLPRMIQETLQREMANFRHQQEVDSIVSRNAEWMYQQDANGRPVMGVGGRPVATPEGARYGQIVNQLERGGMRNPSQVDALARQILLGEMAQRQIQQGGQQPPAQQQRMALASSRSQRNVLQSLGAQQRQQTPGATEPSTEGMSLHEMLTAAFDQAGFTDADFRDPDALTR